MKPIKLADLLKKTAAKRLARGSFELAQIGMYHASPRELGRPVLTMRYDTKTERLQAVR